jgi:hypothetical protein
MEITEFNMMRDGNDEHLLKQASPIEVTESEMKMDTNDEHL